MNAYNVLLSDSSYREIYADSPEIAERDVERELWSENSDVFVVIAEEV